MNEFCIIMTTSNAENARAIAEALIGQKLAACVQMLNVGSVYEWNGEVCRDDEVLLLIKTRSDLFEKCEKTITGMHDYELPEIIKTDITGGSEGYLKWILTQTK